MGEAAEVQIEDGEVGALTGETSGDDIQEADYTVEDEGGGLVPGPSTELVHQAESYIPRIKLTPEESMERQAEVHTFLRESLKDGVDFGVIPGCGSKPSLFKPGAEKLAMAFGLAIQFPAELCRKVEDFQEGFFFYAYMAHLVDRGTGVIVAQCEGSANSKEKRFASYSNGDPRNPFDQANPVNKMAQKRAFVGGVLVALALSQVFTTDVEDMDWSQGQGKGSGGGSPGSGPFSLDAKIEKGKHAGKTWEFMCVNEPDFIMWAIGRKDGDGLRYLNRDAKNALGERLDELAQGGGVTENRQESTQPAPEPEPTLVDGLVGFGKKHPKDTWVEVLKTDKPFIQWCLDNGKVEGEVAIALTALLRDGPPQAAPQPKPEAPREPSRPYTRTCLNWGEEYVQICSAAETSLDAEKALAKMHPGLKDNLDDWDEPEFELACREFHRHGTLAVLDRALKAFQRSQDGGGDREPPPDANTLPKALRDKADSVGDRAQMMGIITEGDRDAVRAMIRGGSKNDVEEMVDGWERKIYAKIGDRGRP